MKDRATTQEEAEIAIRAYDASLYLQRGHVRSGILEPEVARIFAMMDAIRAVDDVRSTGTATINCDPKDPAYRAEQAKGKL